MNVGDLVIVDAYPIKSAQELSETVLCVDCSGVGVFTLESGAMGLVIENLEDGLMVVAWSNGKNGMVGTARADLRVLQEMP